MLNRDFDHLSTLLHLFFEREDICQKLNIIDQKQYHRLGSVVPGRVC